MANPEAPELCIPTRATWARLRGNGLFSAVVFEIIMDVITEPFLPDFPAKREAYHDALKSELLRRSNVGQ